MDPDNAIMKLCVEGMQAERDGKPGDAARLFGQAWEESTNDFEACVAAHYVARHQVRQRPAAARFAARLLTFSSSPTLASTST